LTTFLPGNYVVEAYYEITGSSSSTSLCTDSLLIDNNGTNFIATYSIQANPTYSSTNPTTCNGTQGSITISGLTPNTSFNVSYNFNTSAVGPTAIVSNTSGEIILTGLSAGTYANFQLIANGCSFPYSTPIVLVAPSTPSVTLNNVSVCQGQLATLTATPTTPSTYNYVWTVPSGAIPGNVAFLIQLSQVLIP